MGTRKSAWVFVAVTLAVLLSGVAEAGLVEAWGFNADVAALQPLPGETGSYTGTLVGNAYTSGGYLVLDGDGDYLQLLNIAAGHFAGQQATLSMWVKLNLATQPANPAGEARTGIEVLGNPGTLNSHWPWTNSLAYLSTFRADRVDSITLRADVDRAQWHHIAVVTAPGTNTWRVYEDGQEIRTANPNFYINANPTIGKSAGNHYTDGMLDDVAIFDHALAPGVISAIAQRTLTIQDITAINPGGLGVIGVIQPNSNAALGGTATQSSTAYGGVAPRAIDGNTDGNWGVGSVTHTAGTVDPWWQVDLGATRTVDQISLWNRTDCCSDRLTNFSVSLLDSSQSTVWTQDYYTTGGNPSPSLDIPLASLSGQYVRVQKHAPGGSDQSALSLAEVQVFSPSNFTLTTNDILGMEIDALAHTWDRVIAGGTLTLDGELRVYLLNDSPQVHDVFDLLDWGTLVGQFASIQLPALAPTLLWDTSQLYVDGTLSVVTPEPTTLALLGLGLATLARRRKRR